MSGPDMSHARPTDPHAADVHGSSSHADDHGGGHGGPSATESEPLGPVDVQTWAYAIVGGALGVLIVVALYLAST